MNRVLKLITIALLFASCSNNNSSDGGNTKSADSKAEVNFNALDTSSIDFLRISDTAKNEGFVGNIGGGYVKDSIGPHVGRVVYTDSLSFELFYQPKGADKKKVDFDSVRVARLNNYEDYNLLVFVYDMVDPDKAEDYHADNTRYPTKVKFFRRVNNKWLLLEESTVKSLVELANFELKCISNNMK